MLFYSFLCLGRIPDRELTFGVTGSWYIHDVEIHL